MCAPGQQHQPDACMALARLRAALSVPENDKSEGLPSLALPVVVSSEVRSVALHDPNHGAAPT